MKNTAIFYESVSQNDIALKLEEKKQIKKTAGFIGLAMLITVAVTFLWATIYINIVTALGVDSLTAIGLLEDPAVLQLVNQLLSAVMFTLPFFVVLLGCNKRLLEVASFKKPDKEFLIPIILISLGLCAFANMAGTFILNLLAQFGIYVSNPMIEEPDGIFGKFLVFAGACIIAPLAEEFAMRGVVMGTLRKFGDGFAICISALLFGLMHGNLAQMPFAFIVGLALGFAVIKTGSLWTGVLIHFINNFLATVLSWLIPEDSSIAFQNAAYCLYFAICFLCAFVGVLMLKDKSKKAAELNAPETYLTQKQFAAAFLTHPCIIIYIILIAVETILVM